ncbi:MAG TPA: cytochrome c peroxidase [Gemmatimonadales bacterium]|jgi:cytochrome c peroxidase
MTTHVRTLCILAVFGLAACDEPNSVEGLPESLDAQLRGEISRWGVVQIGGAPRQDPALVALGQALMFDRLLSGNRDIACATCHDPAQHMTDGLALAVGTGGTGSGPSRTLGAGRTFVPRNAPTLLNTAIGLPYIFWEGRLTRFGPPLPDVVLPPSDNVLVSQAMLPVLNRREMRGKKGDVDVFGNPNELAQLDDTQPTAIWQGVMQRLLAVPGYVSMFRAAFPSIPTSNLTFQDAARAIAAFQMHALMKTGSPFDRYLARDNNAMALEAKRGGVLFFGQARCSQCHNGPFLGGRDFANTAVPQLGPGMGLSVPLDKGRAELFDFQFYQFAFRVPPLRNVELTAPYFHDGSFATLEAVVKHYNDVTTSLRTFDPSTLPAGVRDSYHGDAATIDGILATLDPRVQAPLHLTDAQIADLVAFLKSLTDPAARDLSGIAPVSVPSGLPVR